MKRTLGLGLLLAAQPVATTGCGGGACVEADLSLWCFHSEDERGPAPPSTDAGYTPPRLEEFPEAKSAECNADYWVVGEEAGLVQMEHYWDAATGEHVATRYWNDVAIYCNGNDFWYGERACR